MLQHMIAGALLALGASLIGSGVVFRHRRVTTYLAAALVLWEGHWLLLTVLSRVFFTAAAPSAVFAAGALVLLAGWLTQWRSFQLPRLSSVTWLAEAAVVGLLSITCAGAWPIVFSNGFDESAWITHGFYNGDTATFISLVQASFLTDALVSANPFAGNGPLEYPTLLHGAVADGLTMVGRSFDWLHALPAMTLLQIVITVPLFFLLWDAVFPPANNPLQQRWLGISSRNGLWLQAAIAGFIMLLSWDNFIYPQSHFFLTGLFLLQASLLVTAYRQTGNGQSAAVVAATAAGLALMLSNAVTGTAATALLLIFYLARAFDRKRLPVERGAFLLGVPVLAGLFLAFTPGNASFGVLGFSYTAAFDMLRLAPLMALLLVGVFLHTPRQPFLTAGVIGLAGLAFVTFVLSTRNIVVENAARFFYHALLVGFPLLASVMVRLYFWLKQELVHSSRTLLELLTGWGTVIVALGFLLLPAGASVASAYDNLLRKDRQVVSPGMLEALDWLHMNAPVDSIVAASPEAPWAVPMFTGRALLRANYWLVPEDQVLADLNAAFLGDQAAQEQVAPQADYLFLTSLDRNAWEPLSLPQAFANDSVVIYRIE